MRPIMTATTLLLVAASAQVAQAQTRVGLELGSEPAPLVLESISGGVVDLAPAGQAAATRVVDLGSVMGQRPVLLQFWATWCPKCEALHPEIVAAHARFRDRVQFFGIAVAVGQNPRRIRRHLEDHPLPFPMLWDGSGEAVRRFMAPTTSYIVILDHEGRVAYTGIDIGQDIRGALERIVGNGQSDSDS